MRAATWVGIMFFIVIAAGMRVHSSTVRASSKIPPAGVANTSPPNSWIVEGKWEKNQEDALASAFREAEAKIRAYLQSKNPEAAWLPDAEYIREHFWKDLSLEDVAEKPVGDRHTVHNPGARKFVEEEKDFADQQHLGRMRKSYVKVALSSSDFKAIQQQERRVVSEQRQVLLAKILGAATAFLGVIFGYFRLEEATKGYYTTVLRVAVVGALAAVVAALLLV